VELHFTFTDVPFPAQLAADSIDIIFTLAGSSLLNSMFLAIYLYFLFFLQIRTAFVEGCRGRSALCVLDLSKAFDAINHTLIIDMISDYCLHPNLVCWLATYIRGHQALCTYNSKKSALHILRCGIPQRSLLSLLSLALFDHYVSDCPILDIFLTSYTGDF
jgi:hypothetical protein